VAPSRTVIRLAWIAAALATFAAAVGVLWQGGVAPETVTSVRGDTVALHGRGLYRFDSAYRGPVNQGTDVVALALFVPLLVGATLRYRHGSIRGALLVAAALLWLLYLHLSLAVSAAYNELFLVYVAQVAITATGLVLLARSFDLEALGERLTDRFPRLAISRFFLVVCGVTGLLWEASPWLRSPLAARQRISSMPPRPWRRRSASGSSLPRSCSPPSPCGEARPPPAPPWVRRSSSSSPDLRPSCSRRPSPSISPGCN
jgi:hypothetical protein